MARIRFRAATPADDAFFREIEFQTTWDSLAPEEKERVRPEEMRAALSETHELLLARPGNQIRVAVNEEGERVGLLWYGLNRNLITGENEAWVYNVTVLPDFQGQGIGAMLMAHAEELARRGGFPTLGLMVSAHNERARALYEKLSFRATNYLMRKKL